MSDERKTLEQILAEQNPTRVIRKFSDPPDRSENNQVRTPPPNGSMNAEKLDRLLENLRKQGATWDGLFQASFKPGQDGPIMNEILSVVSEGDLIIHMEAFANPIEGEWAVWDVFGLSNFKPSPEEGISPLREPTETPT